MRNEEIQREVDSYQKGLLDEALAQCTPDQQVLFKRMYPNGPTKIQMVNAIGQCRRTIELNEGKTRSVTANPGRF